MSWKDALKEGTELVLATSSEDKPNANVVVSLGLVDDKLLVADCQMKTTLSNLQENNNVCIVVIKNKEYYRIKGKAHIYPEGKYFDLAAKKSGPDYPVKNAILIEIKEVFDLDKGKAAL